jgi:hypothetical protein
MVPEVAACAGVSGVLGLAESPAVGAFAELASGGLDPPHAMSAIVARQARWTVIDRVVMDHLVVV